jgi:hypothetical protein
MYYFKLKLLAELSIQKRPLGLSFLKAIKILSGGMPFTNLT